MLPSLRHPVARREVDHGAKRPLLQELVDSARLATQARIVQVTYFNRETRLIESLAWSGFRGGLPEAAIRMAQRLVPTFDPYQVRPRVDVNRCNERVYLEGRPILATFEDVAIGAVDHRILAVAIAIAKIRQSYMLPLRLEGEVYGALGFHAQDISDDQRQVMDGFVGIAEALIAL